MATVYPSAYDTETATSLGVDKSNDEPVIDSTIDIDATEFTTVKGAVRQLELKLGDGSSVLTLDGDADEANVREYMDFMMTRADKAGFHDHLVHSNTNMAANQVSWYVDPIAGGANPAFATVAGGTGVSSQTLPAARTGLSQTDDIFHFRSTYFRCRFYIDTLAFVPWANGDIIEVGLIRGANDYVRFRSTAAGGAFPDFTYEIYDGGAGTGAVLTGSAPAAAEWHVAEILTTSTGAYFFMDRNAAGGYTEYKSGLYTGTAPDNGQCNPFVACTCAAGGPVLSVDAISCQDTRTL